MKNLNRFSIFVYLLALALSAVFQNFNITFSVALGGAISIANLSLLENLMSKLLAPESNPSLAGAVSAAFFFMRFAFIALVIFICVNAGWINFIALLIGLSITVLSIFAWSLAIASGSGPAFDANTSNEKSSV